MSKRDQKPSAAASRAAPASAAPASPVLGTRRVVAALSGAIALVSMTGVAGAQPQAGFPTLTPPDATHQAIPVEVAVTLQDGAVACRPPEARLPAGTIVRLQIVNLTEHAAAIVAPDFFGAGERIASVVAAQYAPGAPAIVVSPGAIGQVVVEVGAPGVYRMVCDAAAPGATPGEAEIAVIAEGMQAPPGGQGMQGQQGMQMPQQGQGGQAPSGQGGGMQMPFFPAPGG